MKDMSALIQHYGLSGMLTLHRLHFTHYTSTRVARLHNICYH